AVERRSVSMRSGPIYVRDDAALMTWPQIAGITARSQIRREMAKPHSVNGPPSWMTLIALMRPFLLCRPWKPSSWTRNNASFSSTLGLRWKMQDMRVQQEAHSAAGFLWGDRKSTRL